MVVTIHKTQAKALGSDVWRSFKITCMFLRSWLSVRASEPCPIMISNRSKGLLQQIGARVDFLRKLRAMQHFLSSSLLKATDPVPPPEWWGLGSFPIPLDSGILHRSTFWWVPTQRPPPKIYFSMALRSGAGEKGGRGGGRYQMEWPWHQGSNPFHSNRL